MTRHSSSLAISKIRLPPRSGTLIRRPRLVDYLYTQIEKQIFLISAPAGYGKTSLLLDWAHDADFLVAWYTLDEFDNTPHTFLAYLIESIRVHFPEFGAQALVALDQSADTLTSLQSVVAMIANEIAHLSDHLAIILDDYHEIQNEVIDQLVALLVRYAGENGHLFIGSRTLPRIPNQSLLLARGQMSGMGINELQFTAPEIQALAQQNYGLIVSERRAQELAQITKGWITALLLMGYQSGWRQLVESAVALPKITEHVFDYLAEQIFSIQPEDVRHFLLGSSVLDPLSPDTLDHLPELSRSRTYLKMLLEQHLFVTELGGSEELYSYHPLFREFLRARLKREHPAWYAHLYLACARIYTEQEQWDRVVQIYLDLGRTEDAVATLESAEESLRKLSDIAAMTHRFEDLPRSTAQFGPHLLSLKGKIHMARGEQEQAVMVFDQAVDVFQDIDDYASAADKAVWKGTALRFLGRYRECIAESKRVETFLARLPDHPARTRLRAASLHMRGISRYYLGDLANAYADLKRARDLFRSTDDLGSQANVNHDLGITARASGRLAEAVEHYKAALTFWERLQYPSGAANTLNSLGVTYLLKGETQEAERILREALSKSREGGWLRIEAGILASLGDLYREQGDYPQALEFYGDSLRLAQQGHEGNLIFYNQWATGDTYRLMGSWGRAREWLDSASSSLQVRESSVELGQLKLAQGMLARDQGQLDSAFALISQATDLFRQSGNKHWEGLAEYRLAHVLHQQGRADEARAHLIQTVELIETLGYDQFLVAEGRRTIATLKFASTLKQVGHRFKQIMERVHPLPPPLPRHVEVTPATPSVAVYTLGQEKLIVNGTEVTELRPQPKELFLFLLARIPTGARKEELADLFWPDLSAERADGVLRITLTRIRKSLCPVSPGDGRYSIAPEHLWYDVHEFEQGFTDARRAQTAQARISRLKQTLKLYQGDYLGRLEAHWALNERERLRSTYLGALMLLADAYAQVEELDSALSTFQKAAQVEPFFESAWQGAMKIYLRMGNRAAAITHYERLKQVLRDEMEIEPSPELQALYRDIVNMRR